jgi:hypothetical protein
MAAAGGGEKQKLFGGNGNKSLGFTVQRFK